MGDIAIVGMACVFPGAKNIQEYWQNILDKVDSTGNPPEEWESERYFDPDSTTNDRIYCKRGGYLGDLASFNPYEHGVMPLALDGGEPDHYLTLKVAKDALNDAGYSKNSVNQERTEVIIGRGTYINRGVTNLFQHGVVIDQTIQILKELHPEHTETELNTIKRHLKEKLPPFNAETVPCLVPNVLAGRISNKLDFMGANYLVDAACASSLMSVEHGMRDLLHGKCDMAVVGGVNVSIPPPILMIFCQINALSRHQKIRPFDEAADGTLLGEGVGIVVLKRKKDAERDNDRIYATLKAVGVASDGRGLGLLAPRVEGQVLAMKRAYEDAKISPQTVELIEAHGTGVPLGDITEIEAMRNVFGSRNGKRPSCAVGTVKSMIGHLIPATGIAGLIKTTLALHHKILPPTINCDKPNPKLGLEKTPFYINTETRPWIHGHQKFPRRAGVNAFGFGGINAHAILEEYTEKKDAKKVNIHRNWDTEVFLFRGGSRLELIQEINQTRLYITKNPNISIKDLAFTLNVGQGKSSCRLAVVANACEELAQKLEHTAKRLADTSRTRIRDKSGIYFFEEPLGKDGKVAFLFPGEGSQYINMLSDLCIHFPEIRACFDLVDRAFIKRKRNYSPSQTIFKLPLGQDKSEEMLWDMDSAAESVFTASQALLKLMERLGLCPDILVGHSTGEYSALLASGMLVMENEDQFIEFVLGVNKVYEKLEKSGKIAEGVLLSVGTGDRGSVLSVLKQSPEQLYVAMDNCPHQVILCGSEAAVSYAENAFRENGAICNRLPFSRAYHTPLFKSIITPLRKYFDKLEIKKPRVKTYSCASAKPYPNNPDGISDLLTSQWARKVRFTETIEALYDEGVRIFIEVGPRGNLTAFVDDILRKKPYLAVASNLHRLTGTTQLNHMVGLLYAHHVPLNPEILYEYRAPEKHILDKSEEELSKTKGTSDRSVKISTVLPRINLKGIQLKHKVGTSPFKASMDEVKVTDKSNGPKTEHGIQTPLVSSSLPDTESTSRSQVMSSYFENMEEFLKIQTDVYQAFLTQNGANTGHITSSRQEDDEQCRSAFSTPSLSSLPTAPEKNDFGQSATFISEVVSLTPGKQVIAICELDLNRNKFLRDHTIGGEISESDSELEALPVVPLTFSMEVMAEGAALLMNDRKLTGMREIRAYRWIGLDDEEKTLQIFAEKVQSIEGAEEVKVQIREVDILNLSQIKPGLPIIEGFMVFDNMYQEAPEPGLLNLTSSRPSKWAGVELYDGFMFHGPSLQGVASMDTWGEDGVTATLRAMPEDALFDSSTKANFMSDPVVLDAAGQVIAYWTSDHLTKGFHIFPFRVEAIHIYGPRLKAPETAKCHAKISLVGDDMVRSDIDIIGPNGCLRFRLLGWWDKRFTMPREFYDILSKPQDGILSTSYSAPTERFAESQQLECTLFNTISHEFLEDHDRIWERVLARLTLGRNERDYWQSLKGANKRRLDWLFGRIAAKDAVRLLSRKRYGVNLYPADIEIENDEFGKPKVANIRSKEPIPLPSISLSHTSGIAVAIAGYLDQGLGVGVDTECLRLLEEGFDQIAFSSEERVMLFRFKNSEKIKWTLSAWCAKEAVSKALGRGLMGQPNKLVVKDIDCNLGIINVEISDQLSGIDPNLFGSSIPVHIFINDNIIIASTICKIK